MKDDNYKKILNELCRHTNDELITPLLLEYYQLEIYGIPEEDIMEYLERGYSQKKSIEDSTSS